jgi:Rrf2 family protein
MKLSTRGCYGLRALLVLAKNYGGGPVLMKEISEEQGLSMKYLYILLSSLKTAGLVRSVRGVGGGFVLTRAPSGITVWEAVHALEGSLAVAECVEDSEGCHHAGRCATLGLWQAINQAVARMLERISLADLLGQEAVRAEEAAAEPVPLSFQI